MLLQEHEEDRCYEATERHEMIPLQLFSPKEDDGEEGKDCNGNDLLYHLQLHQSEGTAIAHKANAVGRHLTGILKERQKPADEDNDVEWCVVGDELHLLQLQVPIPGERHEDVRHDEQ